MRPTLTTAYTNAGAMNVDMSPAAASQAYGNAKSFPQINGMDPAAASQHQRSNTAVVAGSDVRMARAGTQQTDSDPTASEDQQADANSADVDMSPASPCMASTAASRDEQIYPETVLSSDVRMAHAEPQQTDRDGTASKDQQADADSADVDMSPAASQDRSTVGNAQSGPRTASTAATQDEHTYPETVPSSDKESNLIPLPSDNGDDGPGVDAEDAEDQGPSEDNGDDGPGVDAEDAEDQGPSEDNGDDGPGVDAEDAEDQGPSEDNGDDGPGVDAEDAEDEDEGSSDEFDDDDPGVGTDDEEYEPQGDSKKKNGRKDKEKGKKNPTEDKKKGKAKPTKDEGKTPDKKSSPVSAKMERSLKRRCEEMVMIDFGEVDSDPEPASLRLVTLEDEQVVVTRSDINFEWEIEFADRLFEAVEANYLNGVPRHMCPDSATSKIHVMTNATYEGSEPQQILNLLRHRHLLITEQPFQEYKFDEVALRLLGSLERSLRVHGKISSHSSGMKHRYVLSDKSVALPPGNTVANYQERIARPKDLLDAFRLPNCKAINALDNPLIRDPFPPQPYQSCWNAWEEVLDRGGCKRNQNYPLTDMRWGLASTGGTLHPYHIDTNGFGTFIRVDTGIKFWILATPKSQGKLEAFARTDLFVGSSYDPEKVNDKLWDLELMVLKPGMTLIMRPNTPHVVITPEPTICRGGHFYCSSTIRDSIYGIYHLFVGSSLLTNADHRTASQMMLTRLLALFHRNLLTPDSGLERDMTHVPNVLTFDGVLDLLCLCNYFEIAEALSVWGYSDRSRPHAIISLQLDRAQKDRLKARQLIEWFFTYHELLDVNKRPLRGENAMLALYYPLLWQQICTLLAYKKKSWKSGCRGEDNSLITPNRMLDVVANGLGISSSDLTKEVDDSDHTTFAWTGDIYTVQKIENPGTNADSTME
ncbi:hypothetical protein C0989_008561 [Termitomyces sp. Mn162]|nr:hypothetical protein C0989_008561 [Termitomyces sp. Mn162]